MVQRLAILLLPLALLAAACSSDGSTPSTNIDTSDSPASVSDTTTDDSDPSAVTDDTSADDAEPPASETDTTTDDSDSDFSAVGGLLSRINPLQLLDALSEPGLSDPDPELAKLLITSNDLPGGFIPFGETSLSTPTEFGQIDMIMSIFASGDIAANELEVMVMSVAAILPPEALEELGDLSALAEITQQDLDQIDEELGGLGDAVGDIALLDASHLGDGGFGLHFELDFGALFGSFGATEDDLPFSSISMDMIMFIKGDLLLMIFVMAPDGNAAGIDALELAELMDERS